MNEKQQTLFLVVPEGILMLQQIERTRRGTMFTGNIIDELIAAVQRAEGRADIDNRQQDPPAYETTNTEAALAGVA